MTNIKPLTEWTGEELAEGLSGSMQKLMNVYADVMTCMNELHLIQNELERRKLGNLNKNK